MISALFHYAIIKYARPFKETDTSWGRVRYKTKELRSEHGFDEKIHNHLIDLRDQLIAHDSMKWIEPKLLDLAITPEGTNFRIPITIVASNKCLAYPSDKETVIKIREHVTACVRRAKLELEKSLAEMRNHTIENLGSTSLEDQIISLGNAGSFEIEKGGTRLKTPPVMNHEWLNATTPKFDEIHNGFTYEEMRLRSNFYGPEEITLPNGGKIIMKP